MKCPYCNHADTRVIDSRPTELLLEEGVHVMSVANVLPHMRR